MSTPIRIQRQRTKGWRMPEGAVYVGRPSLFGNPWSLVDARNHDIPEGYRAAWCVWKYREELDHLGLLGDWAGGVTEARWDEMMDAVDALPQEIGPQGIQSIRPLFRHLLRDATALACWCPLDQPCHADVLIELLTKRWVGGVYITHCSTTDGPCQGHGPVSPAPNPAPNSGRWCPKGLHQGAMRERSDQNRPYCRGCERERQRARRRAA